MPHNLFRIQVGCIPSAAEENIHVTRDTSCAQMRIEQWFSDIV